MLRFASSNFFSQLYKPQQLFQLRGNLDALRPVRDRPGMNDHIPPSQKLPVSADTFPDTALDGVSTHRLPESSANRDAEATVTQLIGAVEDL